MTVLIDRGFLRSTIATAKTLFYSAWFAQLIALFVELVWGGGSFLFDLICVVIFVFVFRSNERVFKKLQYSLWSFLASLILWNLWLIFNSDSVIVQNAALISGVLFFSLGLHMSPPYLYPRLTWWEYDFRFNGDLKILVHRNESSVQGRLTDLRKNAGCVHLFENLKPGDKFTIDYKMGEENLKNEVQIVSRREAFFGRGYLYGVRFLFDKENPGAKKNYKRLSRIWRVKKKVKRQLKAT